MMGGNTRFALSANCAEGTSHGWKESLRAWQSKR